AAAPRTETPARRRRSVFSLLLPSRVSPLTASGDPPPYLVSAEEPRRQSLLECPGVARCAARLDVRHRTSRGRRGLCCQHGGYAGGGGGRNPPRPDHRPRPALLARGGDHHFPIYHESRRAHRTRSSVDP